MKSRGSSCQSYNTVCTLNINAIKTIVKVSGIQFSEVFKAKSTQYTVGSFKSWDTIRMTM